MITQHLDPNNHAPDNPVSDSTWKPGLPGGPGEYLIESGEVVTLDDFGRPRHVRFEYRHRLASIDEQGVT